MLNLSYLFTFLLSSTLEVPIYGFGYRKHSGFFRVFLLVTLANLFTHPIVFFGFMSSKCPYLWAVLAAETFAVVMEALMNWIFLPGTTLPRTFSYALFANLFSWEVAPMITWGLLALYV